MRDGDHTPLCLLEEVLLQLTRVVIQVSALDLLKEPLSHVHLSKEDVHVVQIGLVILKP